MFFVHPEHGAHNASETEAAELEKRGWKVSTPDEWFRMNGKVRGAQAEPEQEQPTKRKPGRPRKDAA
jgi:hypothetical protein